MCRGGCRLLRGGCGWRSLRRRCRSSSWRNTCRGLREGARRWRAGDFAGRRGSNLAAARENLKFEISDLREERGGGLGSQSADPRLLLSDRGEVRGENRRGEIAESRHDAGNGERFRDSRTGEKRAGAAAGGRGGTGREPRNAAGWSGIKECLEGTQAQDLGLNWNLNGNEAVGWEERRSGAGDARGCRADADRGNDSSRTDSCESKSNANANSLLNENSNSEPSANFVYCANANSGLQACTPRFLHVNPNSLSEKELAVWRELRVGQGPVCAPAGVRPEVIERDRRREAARAGLRSRSG